MPDNDVACAPARPFADPFVADRAASGAIVQRFGEEDLLLLLRWKDVRTAARDHARFDSGVQGRVPVPPETGIRTFRQLPIETNPPEHSKWRDILQPFFRRPMDAAIAPLFQAVLADRLTPLIGGEPTEMIADFALPVQSAALAVLLDTPPDLAAEWQGWGLHAFRTDGKTDPAKAARFLDFIDRMLDRGETDPAMGLFSALHTAQIDDRPLTRDEKRGLCHLSLAGGRDTVINALVGTMAYLAGAPDDIARLHDQPGLIPIAAEEIFRVLSPLPMIGRVCPQGYRHGSYQVAPDARVGLCWAAANRDPAIFEGPGELRIDRAPNPHVAFGAGAHTCLGAPMARLLVRTLLHELSSRVARIEIVAQTPRKSPFATPYLYDALHLHLVARS